MKRISKTASRYQKLFRRISTVSLFMILILLVFTGAIVSAEVLVLDFTHQPVFDNNRIAVAYSEGANQYLTSGDITKHHTAHDVSYLVTGRSDQFSLMAVSLVPIPGLTLLLGSGLALTIIRTRNISRRKNFDDPHLIYLYNTLFK